MSFWTTFWLTNIHFAIELFGTLTFLIVAYVLFRTWISNKQIKITLRIFGFALLALHFMVHSGVSLSGWDVISSWLTFTKFFALLFIAISFFIDPVQVPPSTGSSVQEGSEQTGQIPQAKPEPVSPTPQGTGLSSISAFLIPALSIGLAIINLIISTFTFLTPVLSITLAVINLIVLGAITARVYLKYIKGLEKDLKNLFWGFVFLFLAELVSSLALFKGTSYILISKLIVDFGPVWITSHILQFVGFIFIAIYAWGYLRFKLFSQVVGAFIMASLFIFVTVTFIYTSLLVGTMQRNSLASLRINLQTFEYAIDRLKEQTLATSSVIASNEAIRGTLAAGDNQRLSSLVQEQMISSGVDFLVVVDTNGRVLARGENPEAVSDVLSANTVVVAALAGRQETNIATKEWINAPQVLIEAGAPINASGAVYTGYIIDNAFVDGVKEATGLDVTVFAGDVKSATTLTGSDGVSRLVGVKEASGEIKKNVLGRGELFLGLAKVFHREYLSAYGPLKDSGGNILGMLYVGYPSVVLFEAAQSSLSTTFFVTTIMAILSFIPAYFLAKFIEEHQV